MPQDDNFVRRIREVYKRSDEIEKRVVPYRKARVEDFLMGLKEGEALIQRAQALKERIAIAQEEGASDREKASIKQEEDAFFHDYEEYWRKQSEIDKQLGTADPEQREKYFKEMQAVTIDMSAVAEDISDIGSEISVEMSKLKSDTLKHQSTLSALAIGGIAAITNGPLGQAQSAWFLVVGAYGVLLLTTVVSLLLLHAVIAHVELTLRSGGEVGSILITRRNDLYRISQFGLPIGVALFVIFLVINM